MHHRKSIPGENLSEVGRTTSRPAPTTQKTKYNKNPDLIGY